MICRDPTWCLCISVVFHGGDVFPLKSLLTGVDYCVALHKDQWVIGNEKTDALL